MQLGKIMIGDKGIGRQSYFRGSRVCSTCFEVFTGSCAQVRENELSVHLTVAYVHLFTWSAQRLFQPTSRVSRLEFIAKAWKTMAS